MGKRKEKAGNMKRWYKIAVLFIGMLICAALSKEYSADAKLKVLEEGKNYSYDLDGDGKKERIRFEIETEKKTSEYDYTYTYTVISGLHFYVNNKRSYVRKWFNTNYPPGNIKVELFDLNPSDKIKELKVTIDYCIDESYDYDVLKYSDNELSLLFETGLWPVQGIAEKQSADENVICERAIVCAIGEPVFYSVYRIKDQKLEELDISNKTLKISTTDWFGKKFIYTADTEIPMYKKAKEGKIIYTIRKGESFQLTKIKMVKGKAKYGYVKLKDSKKSGWIDVEGDEWSHHLVVVAANNYI